MEQPPTREAVLQELDRVLASAAFQGAARSRSLLKFLVEETLDNRAERLKEYTLGAEALGKGDAFDPRTDPIVRAEASRLRNRLDRYYENEGLGDAVVIALPRGTYVPRFGKRAAGAAASSSRHMRWLEWTAAVLVFSVFIASALTWGTWRTTAEASHPLMRLEVELTADGIVGSEVGTDVVLSPDSTRIAYVARDTSGDAHLNTRRLDEATTTVIEGTEGARGPFFSPDGRWIAFQADRKLKKVAVIGGRPIVICDAPDLLGGTWGDDGFIVATLRRYQLSRVSASGGSPTVIADLTRAGASPQWPQALPGGNLILFTAIGPTGPNMAAIDVLSRTNGTIKTVARGGTYGRYVGDRYLTYINQGTLMAASFDLDRIELRGTPVPVLDDVSYSSTFGYAQIDVSRDGAVAYRRSAGGGALVLQAIAASGAAETLLAKPEHYGWPRVSPDGQRVALAVNEGGVDNLLIYDRRSKRAERIDTGGDYAFPLWMRNDRTLIVGGSAGLATIDTEGTHKPATLLDSHAVAVPWSVSPDGRRLAYYMMSASTGFDLWTVPIEFDRSGLLAGKPEPFLQSPAFEAYPSFSVDGRWIAYSSNESGRWEIYVRRFPDNGTKVAVSSSGGHIPFWLPNGRELLYETEDHHLFVASYTVTRDSFAASVPRQWGTASLGDTGVLANADVAPDGGSVVAVMPPPAAVQQSRNHITLLLNFFDELRRRGL